MVCCHVRSQRVCPVYGASRLVDPPRRPDGARKARERVGLLVRIAHGVDDLVLERLEPAHRLLARLGLRGRLGLTFAYATALPAASPAATATSSIFSVAASRAMSVLTFATAVALPAAAAAPPSTSIRAASSVTTTASPSKPRTMRAGRSRTPMAASRVAPSERPSALSSPVSSAKTASRTVPSAVPGLGAYRHPDHATVSSQSMPSRLAAAPSQAALPCVCSSPSSSDDPVERHVAVLALDHEREVRALDREARRRAVRSGGTARSRRCPPCGGRPSSCSARREPSPGPARGSRASIRPFMQRTGPRDQGPVRA